MDPNYIEVAFKKNCIVRLRVSATKNEDNQYTFFGNCLEYAAGPIHMSTADTFAHINEVITYFKRSGGKVKLTLTYECSSITGSGFSLPSELALSLVDNVKIALL